MARSAGVALPDGVRELLDGTDLERAARLTVQLLTVDEAGWPRVALLSAGELLATGPRDLRLALWSSSRTTANLGRTGRATLALVHGGAGWYFRCAARRDPDLTLPDGQRLASFALTVEEALEDAVPDAELTSGIEFRLAEPDATLAGWRVMVAAMRVAAG